MGMKMADGNSKKPLSLQEQLSSYYKPPYTKPQEENTPTPGDNLLKSQVEQHTQKKESTTVPLWPIFSLLLGAQCFIFSFIFAVFAKNGILHCSWTPKVLFVLVPLTFPLIYFGYKGLELVDSDLS